MVKKLFNFFFNHYQSSWAQNINSEFINFSELYATPNPIPTPPCSDILGTAKLLNLKKDVFDLEFWKLSKYLEKSTGVGDVFVTENVMISGFNSSITAISEPYSEYLNALSIKWNIVRFSN